MAGPSFRTVTVTRTDAGTFTAHNVRGGTLTVGDGEGSGFTPTELLLAAIGSCTGIDVDTLTTRRATPDSFEVQVEADKVRDESGNRLENIVVTFRVTFPGGEAGAAAREVLPEAVARSHDRICTVGRTVEIGTPIGTRIDA
jgi:putative redox protein